MGSKILPYIADIFVNIMEKDIMKSLVDESDIIGYSRSVDDTFAITPKGK